MTFTPNVVLLKETLAEIELNPESWDQDDWRTCFAGHAVTLAGGRWHDEMYLLPEADDPDEDIDRGCSCSACKPRPPAVHVWHRARRILGLDYDEAWALFRESNTLEDLPQIIGEICEQAAEQAPAAAHERLAEARKEASPS